MLLYLACYPSPVFDPIFSHTGNCRLCCGAGETGGTAAGGGRDGGRCTGRRQGRDAGIRERFGSGRTGRRGKQSGTVRSSYTPGSGSGGRGDACRRENGRRNYARRGEISSTAPVAGKDFPFPLAGVAASRSRVDGSARLPVPPFHAVYETETDAVGGSANLSYLYGIVQGIRVEKEVNLYQCPGISSPMVAGFLRPFLVLPAELYRQWEEELSEAQRALRAEYVLRHELVHLTRRDLYYKWLVQAVICIHWFNPLLTAAAAKISEDCELSCDEAVIGRLSMAGRIAYGDTLVASLQALHAPARQEVCAALGENTGLMKERLLAIMKYEKKAAGKRRAAAVLLAGLLLAAGFVCGGFSAQAVGNGGINSGKTTQSLNNVQAGNTAQAGKTEQTTAAAGVHLAEKPAGAQGTVIHGGEEVAFWGDNRYKNAWEGQFATSTYFKNRYSIQLAWNNGPENYGTVRTITAGGKDWQIAFTEETDSLAGDEKFIEALKLCVLEQKQREENADPTGFWNEKNKMTQPVVFYVEGPYTLPADILAENAYEEEDSLSLYAAVVNEVSPQLARSLGERAYEEDDAALFSLTVDAMSENDRMDLATKAYEEDNVSMFSIICNELSEAHRKQLKDRAQKEEQDMYYYILKNSEEG